MLERQYQGVSFTSTLIVIISTNKGTENKKKQKNTYHILHDFYFILGEITVFLIVKTNKKILKVILYFSLHRVTIKDLIILSQKNFTDLNINKNIRVDAFPLPFNTTTYPFICLYLYYFLNFLSVTLQRSPLI